jgi:hypothetical protein
MLLTCAKTDGIIVGRQSILCTGRTCSPLTRVCQKRRLGFLYFETSKPEGFAERSHAEFGCRRSPFRKSRERSLRAHDAAETCGSMNRRNSLRSKLDCRSRAEIGEEPVRTSAVDVSGDIFTILATRKFVLAGGRRIKKCVTVCHPCQKHTAQATACRGCAERVVGVSRE